MRPHELLERALEQFQAGGSLMIPLLLVALAMWTLALAALGWFFRETRKELPPGEPLDPLAAGPPPSKGLADWQREILCGYQSGRCENPELNRSTLESLRTRQEAKAMRHVRSVLLLAGAAPLLGLLGTVTGMIATFDVISAFGTGNARALAAGISEALVTTQSGLVIAVPGLLMGGLLLRRAEKLKQRMELFCIALLRTDTKYQEG